MAGMALCGLCLFLWWLSTPLRDIAKGDFLHKRRLRTIARMHKQEVKRGNKRARQRMKEAREAQNSPAAKQASKQALEEAKRQRKPKLKQEN